MTNEVFGSCLKQDCFLFSNYLVTDKTTYILPVDKITTLFYKENPMAVNGINQSESVRQTENAQNRRELEERQNNEIIARQKQEELEEKERASGEVDVQG